MKTTLHLYKKIYGVLNEETETDYTAEIKKLLKASYPQFVKQLGDNINDKKFLTALRDVLSRVSKVKLTSKTPSVKNLTPTQNEISADKSLIRPLTDVGTASSFLKGGTLTPGGPIITSGGGKYIIDGHHRWSQVYVINPNAKISALDISNLANPVDALKATQIGIAADIGTVPSGKAGGVDLLKTGEAQVKKYVTDNITDDVLEVFKKFKKGNTKEEVADYIWNNVSEMRSGSSPISGAPERDIMPQTGDAPGWSQHAAKVDAIKEQNIKLSSIIKSVIKRK